MQNKLHDSMRIASLTPSNTEIVHALGLVNQLVGVDNYSDYPVKELLNVPRLGPDLQINMDDLVAVKPDLVLASLSVPGMEKVVEDIKQTGIPYVVLNPSSIQDIWEDIRTVGSLTGSKDKADQIITDLQSRITHIHKKAAKRTYKPTLYWEWWPKPCITPGKKNWLTEVSMLAEAQNLFADIDQESVIDVADEVRKRNPDYFLAVWCGVEARKVPRDKLVHRPGWEHVHAIQKNQVYVLEEGMYCRPSPRLIDGLEELVDILHEHS